MFPVASTQPQPQPKSTPLLDALKAEKSAQKDKEAILRNHPHYKDVQIASKKEDQKKKEAPAPSSKPVEPSAPLSKKAAKKAAAAQRAAQQPQKAGISQLQSSATPSTPAVTTTSPPAPPTAPKAMRSGRQQPRAQPQRVEQQVSKRAGTPSSTTDAAPTAHPPAASTSTAEPTAIHTTSVVAPGGRRPRAVLGLGASRQFEAALSGAGVAKPKRERGANKDKETVPAAEGGKGKNKEPSTDDASGPTNTLPRTANNPLLQKKPAISRTEANVLPVTGILQRNPLQPPRILTRTPEPAAEAPPGPITPVTSPGPDSVRGRGFGGRGRGRGRGRGIPRGI